MNMKKGLMASFLAISLLPIQCITVQAVETYDSPTELLTAMVEQSLIDIASDTKNDAITTMRSKVSTNGDEVFYDGQSIGYWFSDDSAYLYKDAEKSSKNIGINWEVSPSLLSLVLTDVNEELVDTVVPTSSNWSKIIGKYDVTLGDVTIPASQWIPLEPDGDPLKNNKVVDISSLTGISVYQPNYYTKNEHQIIIQAYAIDKNGKLYISNGASSHQYDDRRSWIWARGYWLLDSSPSMAATRVNANADDNSVQIASGVNKIKAGIRIETENRLYLQYYTTDLTNANAYYVIPDSNARSDFSTLYDISNASIKNTTPISDMAQTGIFTSHADRQEHLLIQILSTLAQSSLRSSHLLVRRLEIKFFAVASTHSTLYFLPTQLHLLQTVGQ